MRVILMLTSIFCIIAGLLLIHQAEVIHDQRIYIEAGCQSRYQGAE